MVSAFMALPALRRLLRRIMMERESEIRKINRKLIGLHCDCPLAVAFIAVPPSQVPLRLLWYVLCFVHACYEL